MHKLDKSFAVFLEKMRGHDTVEVEFRIAWRLAGCGLPFRLRRQTVGARRILLAQPCAIRLGVAKGYPQDGMPLLAFGERAVLPVSRRLVTCLLHELGVFAVCNWILRHLDPVGRIPNGKKRSGYD